MVRRMLVRATTKSYSQVVAEMVALIQGSSRANAGDAIERFLASQSSEGRYWPDDAELIEAIGALQVYRRLGRGRLRMILEAIEDHHRGWKDGSSALGGERVSRGKLAMSTSCRGSGNLTGQFRSPQTRFCEMESSTRWAILH
jgi:hypothetical protein